MGIAVFVCLVSFGVDIRERFALVAYCWIPRDTEKSSSSMKSNFHSKPVFFLFHKDGNAIGSSARKGGVVVCSRRYSPSRFYQGV